MSLSRAFSHKINNDLQLLLYCIELEELEKARELVHLLSLYVSSQINQEDPPPICSICSKNLRKIKNAIPH